MAKVSRNPLSESYSSILDDIEKKLHVSGDMVRTKLSSGLLAYDLMANSLSPGIITVAGMEASGKSTVAAHVAASAARHNIPVIEMIDAENSVDPDYTSNIFKVAHLETVFGSKVDGKYVTPPKVRYSDISILESVFDLMVRVLRRLPDKRYVSEDKSWYLVTDTKNKDHEGFTAALGKPNRRLSEGHSLWFPVGDSNAPQALFIIDSWPSLLPEKIDEQEESNSALGIQARAFAQHLPRVRGMLRRKGAIIFGVNQLREKPMVRFGDPRYETGGNALKFSSSSRTWISERAVPGEWRHDSKVSLFSAEPSVEGDGTDQYQYKHMRNKKNKDGVPFLEAWGRIWIKDLNGRGRGFDPVFDTYQFLMMTGLATRGKKNAVIMNDVKSVANPLSGKSIPWGDFKALVLDEEYGRVDKSTIQTIRGRYLKNDMKFKIRRWCDGLMRGGVATKLMHSVINSNSSSKGQHDDLEA